MIQRSLRWEIYVASFCALLMLAETKLHGSTQCSSEALEIQQQHIDSKAQIILTNLLTFWNMKFPGRAFQFDHSGERGRSWNPPLSDEQKKSVKVNTGLGCILFIATKDNPRKLPNLCAASDVRAQMTMEAMREAFMNTQGIEDPMFKNLHDNFYELFGEEKIIFCVARPDGQYIDLL